MIEIEREIKSTDDLRFNLPRGRVLEPDDAEMLLGKAIQLFGSLRQGEARVAEEGGFWEDEDEEAT